MEFVDRTLARLANEATRAAIFDQTSLEQIVDATYDRSNFTIEGPFRAVFELFQLGFSADRQLTVEGSWQGATATYEARFQIHGFAGGTTARAEAYWSGGVVARVSHTLTRITAVTTNWRNLLVIDADIVNDLGALPDDPALLENERRQRLRETLRQTMAQPDALTDSVLDRWLDANHASSVSHLLTNVAQNLYPNNLRVAIQEDPPGPTSPLYLPVSAAVFIRPADFSLSELLLETRNLLGLTRKAGLDPARDARLPVRHSVIAVWIVPLSTFDDDDWPGADNAMNAQQRRVARRLAAGAWLAAEGIGLVTVADA